MTGYHIKGGERLKGWSKAKLYLYKLYKKLAAEVIDSKAKEGS